MSSVPIVRDFTLDKGLFGSYTVAYVCPHCRVKLKTKEEDLGEVESCRSCGMEYGVSKKARLEIQRARSTKREEKQRIEAERDAAKPKCAVCGSTASFRNPLAQLGEFVYCSTHWTEQKVLAEKQQAMAERQSAERFERRLKKVIVTTCPSIEGHRIVEYLGVDGVEFVTGTGVISEVASEITDFLGARSGMFESKLREGRLQAIALFKHLAVQQGANAIVGIDFDYSEFRSNRTAIIVNGTLVRIEPLATSSDSVRVIDDAPPP